MALADRTQRAPVDLTAELQQFYAVLEATPPRPPVEWYVWGDSTRDRATQEQHRVNGLSNAAFGQSPHNYSPALAVDVWPVVGGRVAENPEHYEQLTELANSLGLETGASWGDHGHVQLPGWQSRARPASTAALGALLELVALALVVLR